MYAGLSGFNFTIAIWITKIKQIPATLCYTQLHASSGWNQLKKPFIFGTPAVHRVVVTKLKPILVRSALIFSYRVRLLMDGLKFYCDLSSVFTDCIDPNRQF